MKIQKLSRPALPLTNDGQLSIYFIGTGSAFAKTVFQNNVVVVKEQTHLVIDVGTRCMERLNEVGIRATDLDNFLITHTHADHIGGLEEVMLMDRFVVGKRPRIIINEEFQRILWDHSLSGGSAWSELIDGQPLRFEDMWTPLRPGLVEGMPRETWGYDLGSLNVKMPRTMHIPSNVPSWKESFWSCGVILDDRVFFTSDTRFDPELVIEFDRLFDFEIIFHDCQLFTGGVHSSLEELANLPPELKRKMVLMHYGDTWRDYQLRASEAGFHSFALQSHSYVFDCKKK